MLQLRPNCECCDKDLPPDTSAAWICSYECTYCENCAKNVLENVCPNCGGGLTPRPIRPKTEWRPGLSLAHQPPATERTHSAVSAEDMKMLVAKLRHVPPTER